MIHSILNQTKNIETWSTPIFESTIIRQEENTEEKEIDGEGEKNAYIKVSINLRSEYIIFLWILKWNNIVIQNYCLGDI